VHAKSEIERSIRRLAGGRWLYILINAGRDGRGREGENHLGIPEDVCMQG